MAHLSINLIQNYDAYVYHDGRMKKITIGRKLQNGDTLKSTDNLLDLFKNNLL
jgi:hypothetical protein